jgi:CubicO group peptidase (beta-lactamase class C family)
MAWRAYGEAAWTTLAVPLARTYLGGGGGGGDDWRRAMIPSVNGHVTAEAMARLMSALVCDGTLDGRSLLSPTTVVEATKARIVGHDRVLPFDISWGAGFMRNAPLHIYGPGQQTIGHSGWRGSCAFADPERRLAGAYVMNKQSPELIGDPRAVRLIATFVSFVPDKLVAAILCGEARIDLELMLPDAPGEIVGHANIDCAVAGAGDNVDIKRQSQSPTIWVPAFAGMSGNYEIGVFAS